MPRSKKVPKTAEVLAPVPDAILNQFAPEGMLTAADVEAATRRFKNARGLTVRDTGAFLHEMYAVDVSPDLISTVTDAVQPLDCGDRWPHRTVEASPWGRRFPTVLMAWRRAWPQVIPFFAFPPDIRRTIYTTNALENVNRQIRKATKTRGHFLTDEAAIKLIWLAIRNHTARWARGEHHWETINPLHTQKT